MKRFLIIPALTLAVTPVSADAALAVKSVFSSLLHTNEGKVEGSERQSKLRANLDLFSRNIRVSLRTKMLGGWDCGLQE